MLLAPNLFYMTHCRGRRCATPVTCAKNAKQKLPQRRREVCGFVKKICGVGTEEKKTACGRRRRAAYGKPYAADAVVDFVLKTLDGLDHN